MSYSKPMTSIKEKMKVTSCIKKNNFFNAGHTNLYFTFMLCSTLMTKITPFLQNLFGLKKNTLIKRKATT